MWDKEISKAFYNMVWQHDIMAVSLMANTESFIVTVGVRQPPFTRPQWNVPVISIWHPFISDRYEYFMWDSICNEVQIPHHDMKEYFDAYIMMEEL